MTQRINLPALLALSALAGLTPTSNAAAESFQQLGKAQPDECFYGVGSTDNKYPLGNDECTAPAQLKANESYVWGLTKAGNNIFFGTGQNILCLVMESYLGNTDPVTNSDYVCEFGQRPTQTDLDARNGVFHDSRPPGMYLYNGNGLVSLLDKLDDSAKSLRMATVGIRSAGNQDGVAFLAGPGLQGGINLFAFDASTGDFLASGSLPGYDNVRKWLNASDGRLYVGVGRAPASGGGAVLRWTGDHSNPISFKEVGAGLDGDAAELAEHDGRIFVSTWPSFDANNVSGGGLWMSPRLKKIIGTTTEASGEETLDAMVNAGKKSWTHLWSAADFDPDPVTARTYGGGALKSFKGWLYWGTMHVPGVALGAHNTVYGEGATSVDQLNDVLGTWRATSIFRGRNFGSNSQTIQLLYGGATLSERGGYFPAYLCPDGSSNCVSGRTWQSVRNKMGLNPKYGRSGFGNVYNNYCWTMETWRNRLYVGTMDHSYLLFGNNSNSSESSESSPANTPLYGPTSSADIGSNLGEYEFGADLYRFDSAQSAAIPVSTNGLGNYLNYGLRTMVSDDNKALYIGTANPMNLNPEGGWELIQTLK